MTSAGHTAATTTSDKAGRYTLTLPEGRYTLVATPTTGLAFPRCLPMAIAIPASTTAVANIACDTGIR